MKVQIRQTFDGKYNILKAWYMRSDVWLPVPGSSVACEKVTEYHIDTCKQRAEYWLNPKEEIVAEYEAFSPTEGM